MPSDAADLSSGRNGRLRFTSSGLWPGAWLVLFVFLAYFPALHCGFIWDDDAWTTGIAGLLRNLSGLGSIWFRPTALQQYYPLTGTTFWLDYQLWKFWTTPYHAENVLLHALAVLLFWRLLLRLQVPGAWLAAALFALHPVMVESVAWITERKNVLSLALYLAAFLAYLRYAQDVASGKWQVTRINSILSRATCHLSLPYGLALILFLGALLAKTTSFSLPAAILLLVWWRRGGLCWRQDVLPTLPFFTLALGMCAVTFWLEKNHVGAQGSDFALTFSQRCLVAGRAFWFYLGKLVWPAGLCFVYPRWQPDAGAWCQWLYPFGAIGGLGALWLARGRIGRGPITALFFFVGTLFPVLGFMDAYFMRYSFVCDHWVYLSSLGLLALVAALVARAAAGLRVPMLFYGFAILVLPALGLLTWRQTAIYRDSETLWCDTLARNPGSWIAHDNLGASLLAAGHLDKAMDHFRRAIEINPNSIVAHNNYGAALQRSGRLDEAEVEVRKALDLSPNVIAPHINLVEILQKRGRLNEAVEEYKTILQLVPSSEQGRLGLADTLCQLGRSSEAIPCYRDVLEANPTNSDVRIRLGRALIENGEFAAAESTFASLLQADPKSAKAVDGLGYVLARQGRLEEAKARFLESLQLDPKDAYAHMHYAICLSAHRQARAAMAEYRQALALDDQLSVAYNNLAWLLAAHPDPQIRNGPEAVALAERACRLTNHEIPFYVGTLAAAFAEAGRFSDAVATAEKACGLARKAGMQNVVERNEQLLELYRAGRPCHEPAEAN
jgi:protein O-mannosyl-transferase